MSGYITFDCYFNENENFGDEETDLGLVPPKKVKRLVRVNTGQICSYRPTKNKNETYITMANMESFLIDIPVDEFDDLVAEVDNFFDITANAN